MLTIANEVDRNTHNCDPAMTCPAGRQAAVAQMQMPSRTARSSPKSLITTRNIRRIIWLINDAVSHADEDEGDAKMTLASRGRVTTPQQSDDVIAPEF